VDRWREWYFDFMRRYGFEANRLSRRMAVLSVIVAWCVTAVGLAQPPMYRATALLLAGQQQEQWWENSSGSGEEIRTLEYREPLVQTMLPAIDSRPVAAETIERLDLQMEPAELLDRLTVVQAENTQFIDLTYEDTNPQRAKLVANTLGKVVADFAADGGEFSVKVWDPAVTPTAPVRPHPFRDGLLVLIAGLALSSAPIAPTRAAAASAASKLGERVRVVAVHGVGLAWARRRDRSIIERVNEKKLLLALGRRGRLTALEAAVEAELSVEEADRILSELAYRGQLQFDIEGGARVYSFWPHDA